VIKKFNYFIFRFFYPKPIKIIKPNKREVSNLKIGDYSYKVYKINSCRLYTDTIHNMGIIQNKKLLDGPSYQYKNLNFSNIRNNKILQIGTPRIVKNLKGTIFSLLTGGGGNENYYHWLFDVLPRLKLIENIIDLKDINYFLLPALKKKFQLTTLSMLKIPRKKLLSSQSNRHLSSDKIIATSHPYRFNQNPVKDTSIPKWISVWLKNKFLKKKNDRYSYDKIYIDRQYLNYNKLGRSILNNNEIKNFLKTQGFKSLLLENYSFADQIGIFNKAKIIIGLHGAGFANIVFCRKGTKIVEIMSKTAGDEIRNLAKQNNLKYFSIVKKTEHKANFQQGNIKIPLKELKKKLNTIF